MDIEKLKRCLKCCADDNSKACNKCELEYGEEECQNLCGYAATALSTLQAENEQLRAELDEKEKYYDQMIDALAATNSTELEQVKRERDAAIEAANGLDKMISRAWGED